jgi:hypothetical protein
MEHLAKLYQEQLQLKPIDSNQLIDTTELPGFREDRPLAGEEVYAAGEGEIITGGIGGLIEREAGN